LQYFVLSIPGSLIVQDSPGSPEREKR
jgi:hypothetical protein